MPSLVYLFLIRWMLAGLLMTGLLFGAAGRWDLPMVWAYVGTFQGLALLAPLRIIRRHPDLYRERLQRAPGAVDRLPRLLSFPLLACHWLIAGVEIGRFPGSTGLPPGVQILGLMGLVAAFGLAMWAVSVNRYFSSEARIQQDRGQSVVTTGPYGFVRHPGYLAGIAGGLCSALALGSWWSLLPVGVGIHLILSRTAQEDRLLRARLEGYEQYAGKVRFRLIPGVW